MAITWLLCANRSRARLLEVRHGEDAPVEIADFANPAGRAHERDLRADGSSGFYGKGGHATAHGTPHDQGIGEHEVHRFVIDLGEYLERAFGEKRFDQLWISAAPEFLGELRNQLGKGVRKAVELEIDKDVSTEAPREIFRHMRETRASKARA